MFKLILCTLAGVVAYVSAAPVPADNIGVNNATVLPSSFVNSGTHNASLQGNMCNATHRVCTGDRDCDQEPGCSEWQCFMGTRHRGTCKKRRKHVQCDSPRLHGRPRLPHGPRLQ